MAAEVKAQTVVEQNDFDLIENVGHVEQLVVDVRTEIEWVAELEVEFAVGIAVEVDAGDAVGLEVDFVVGIVEVDAGNAAGLEIDSAVDAGDAAEFEVDFAVGDDAEFGFEDLGIEKVVLPDFVRDFEDGQLQHTWSDSRQ